MEEQEKKKRSFDSRNKRTFHSRINAQIEGFIWPQKGDFWWCTYEDENGKTALGPN